MLPSVAFCCVALWSRKDTTTATVRQSRDMWGWGAAGTRISAQTLHLGVPAAPLHALSIGVHGPSLRANTRFAPTCIVYRCPWPIAAGEHKVRPYVRCLSVSMAHRCGRTRGSPLRALSIGVQGSSLRANTRFAPTCIVYRCPWPIAAGEHEVRPYMHCLSVSMTCNLPRCLPMCSRGMTNGHYANHKHPLRAGYPLGAVAPGRSEGAETVRPVSAQKGIGISSDERFLQKRMHMNGFCEQVAHPWTIIGSP